MVWIVIEISQENFEATIQEWMNALFNEGKVKGWCGFCRYTGSDCVDCPAGDICTEIIEYNKPLGLGSYGDEQLALKVLEWLYGYGKKRGWCK